MPWQFNVVERGIVSAEALDSVFAQLLENPGWSDMNTKASHRLVDQWTFDLDRRSPPPSHLQFLVELMQGLFDAMQSETPDDPILPFQCFVCLYETGEDSCPAHAHDCRQLTLAFGAPRAFLVGDRTEILRHGDVIVLDGERHGLPKTRVDGPRASINIFYSTRRDLETRPVSVNHNPRKGYYTASGGSAASGGCAPRGKCGKSNGKGVGFGSKGLGRGSGSGRWRGSAHIDSTDERGSCKADRSGEVTGTSRGQRRTWRRARGEDHG